MAVVPLIPLGVEDAKPTVVETTEQFAEMGGETGTAILIQNLDRAQLLAQNDSNVTYDLRVGPAYQDHRDSRGTTRVLTDGIIKLLPGSAVIIQTEESLRLPRSMFGSIVSKVTLLQQGISNTSSKVDPGYNGTLLVTVFNLGKRTILLKRGDPFCAICFMQVVDRARLYNKPAKQLQGQAILRPWRRLLDWTISQQPILNVLLIMTSIVLVIFRILGK